MGFAKPPFPRLQFGHPLARGLICAYTFHENGRPTIVCDQAPWVESTAPTIEGTTAWTGGPHGAAYDMSVASGGITLSVADSDRFEGLTKFTMICGIYPTATNNGPVYSKSDNSGVMLQRFTDNVCYFRIAAASNSANTAANDLPLNKWSCVATTYDATTMSILVDNVVKGSAVHAALAIPSDGSVMGIGYGPSFTSSMAAKFDYFYFYNRCLTRDEMGAIMVDPFQMFRSKILRARILRGFTTSKQAHVRIG